LLRLERNLKTRKFIFQHFSCHQKP
jgi:hypothetical protein